MGNYIVEARCMVCEVVNYPIQPEPGATIERVETVRYICPECKRAVMYARELLKKKEQSGYFDRPEY